MQADLVAFVTAYLFHITALFILLADWGTACSHMAYVNTYLFGSPDEPNKTMVSVPPNMSPFYARKLPVVRDVFHLIAGLRYLVMVLVAVVVYWDSWLWYAGIALVNYAGWLVLKKLHGKPWGWGLIDLWTRKIR